MKKYTRWISGILILILSLGLSAYSSPKAIPLVSQKRGDYNVEVDLVVWDNKTNEVVRYVDENELDVASLKANQVYAPRLNLENTSSYTKYPSVTAVINGEQYTWDVNSVPANGSHGYVANGAYNGKGEYVYTFYVDKSPACTGYYNVEDSQGLDSELSGYWSDNQVSTRVGHNSSAFILDHAVYSCTAITVELKVNEYTGYPFDYWYVDGRDLSGNWSHLGSFKLKKEDVGKTIDYIVTFNKPQSFDALCIVNSNSYNSYTVNYDLTFRDAKTIY